MENRWVAFDVETPNCRNDRISGIGVTLLDGEKVLEQVDTLVNPETHFDPFNMELTGITPERVADKPNFPELWEKIAPILDQGILVAHNAPFDLSVLGKCLKQYGISWKKQVPYVCTCQISRRLLPQLPNHRLDTLCSFLRLDLNHHQAGSDSLACGEILLYHLGKGANLSSFIRQYDLEEIRTISGRKRYGYGRECQ